MEVIWYQKTGLERKQELFCWASEPTPRQLQQGKFWESSEPSRCLDCKSTVKGPQESRRDKGQEMAWRRWVFELLSNSTPSSLWKQKLV